MGGKTFCSHSIWDPRCSNQRTLKCISIEFYDSLPPSWYLCQYWEETVIWQSWHVWDMLVFPTNTEEHVCGDFVHEILWRQLTWKYRLCKSERPRQVKTASVLGVWGHFHSYRNTKATDTHSCLVVELGLEGKGLWLSVWGSFVCPALVCILELSWTWWLANINNCSAGRNHRGQTILCQKKKKKRLGKRKSKSILPYKLANFTVYKKKYYFPWPVGD